MAQKVTFEAADKKVGMTLEELETYVNKAINLAVANDTVIADSKVKVFVNFGAGIKELIVEV
jgi:hypothetical protein